MLIKLLNVYVDDTDNKLIIDGYNASHHFSRIIRNNKVNFGFSRYVDNASGRFIDRLVAELSVNQPEPQKSAIVKLFDDDDSKIKQALDKKEKEFEKERELYKESKNFLEQRIAELEKKLTESQPTSEDVEKKRGRPTKKTNDDLV